MFNFFSNQGKINRAGRKSKGAIGMFQKAHKALDKANKNLDKVVLEAKRQAELLLNEAEVAAQNMKVNVRVQSKLKDFINPAEND